MQMPFFNRKEELRRITRSLQTRTAPHLIVVYGRRRLGKSTLLQKILRKGAIYFLADQSDKTLQINKLAHEIARSFSGFDAVVYPNWESILSALNNRAKAGMVLALDEFPYLVAESPELPSILQNLIDKKQLSYHIVLCGSSQRMMQGIVIDKSAPLYGRAQEILKIRPLGFGWIKKALYHDPAAAVEGYAVWGGVPRYWELAKDYTTLGAAVKSLILSKYGILHTEPERLLLDDVRSTTQTNSIISLVAAGCNRLSEICGRLQKPATNLSRPLAHLVGLGYLTREIPFRESKKSTKRSLYKIHDPFLMFWYKYVFPNMSLLESDLINDVYTLIMGSFTGYVGQIWEELVRQAVPYLSIGDKQWRPASKWWGTGLDGSPMKIDVVAESLDRKSLLIGEVKWGSKQTSGEIIRKLDAIKKNFPLIKRYSKVVAFFASKKSKNHRIQAHRVVPMDVIAALTR